MPKKSSSRTTFLSFVLLAGDESNNSVTKAHQHLAKLAQDFSKHYEIVVVRSPRKDIQVQHSSELQTQLANTIFVELSSRTSNSSSAVAGLRQAIGDWVLVLDTSDDQLISAERILSLVDGKSQVIFGKAEGKNVRGQKLSYRLGQRFFGLAFSAIHGVNMSKDAPIFRAMSRSAVNLVLSAQRPDVEFRAFITAGSLQVETVKYELTSKARQSSFWESYGSAMQMLLGGTKVPMRLASLFSILGAGLNVVYALYVLAVSILGQNVQDGWASTSLQLSSMFFLVCVVLFLISEYLLQLMPERQQTTTSFSLSFDGDPVSIDKNLNVNKLDIEGS